MFLHDVIKITYVNIGYLPNYPNYLISDKEMIDAFRKEEGFFADYYPCPCEDLEEDYHKLKDSIWEHLDNYISSAGFKAIPNWVYSYMLMRPITYESDEQDIAYLYELTGLEPPETLADFTPELARECLYYSQEWMKKRPSKYRDRPPAMFGEPHVTKCLRLKQANILIESEGL